VGKEERKRGKRRNEGKQKSEKRELSHKFCFNNEKTKKKKKSREEREEEEEEEEKREKQNINKKTKIFDFVPSPFESGRPARVDASNLPPRETRP